MRWNHRLAVRGALLCAMLAFVSGSAEEEWPMFGGRPNRNAVSESGVIPLEWDVDSGQNIKWKVDLGSQTYTSPVVADGRVFIGTNNDFPRDETHKADMGVLMAFSEADGGFLWQALSPKLETGSVNDWPHVGVCSTPLVEGNRLYYVTNRCELVCLDTEGFYDDENDGPVKNEPRTRKVDADVVWSLDMIGELGVFPHNMSNASPVVLGDLIFISTSNGRNEDHTEVPAPEAPSLIAVDKKTGRVVWTDNSPGPYILNGQWSSAAVGMAGGTAQVIIGQGDGWVRGFAAESGEKLWEFDTNPPDSVYPATRNEILATPVIFDGHVYIANGQDPEYGEGDGHLFKIDASKRGDITETGRVWHFQQIRRSISSAVVHQGLLYYPDFSGFLHCLNLSTGEELWTYDTFAAVWGSAVVIGGKVLLGDEDGDVVILNAGRQQDMVAEINMGSPIYSTPTAANGNLYIATMDALFAISDR